MEKVKRMCIELDKYADILPSCQIILDHSLLINKKIFKRKYNYY